MALKHSTLVLSMVVRLLFSNLFSTPGQQIITSADSIKGDVIYVAQKKIMFLRRYFRFSQKLYTLEYLLGQFTDFSEGVYYLHF